MRGYSVGYKYIPSSKQQPQPLQKQHQLTKPKWQKIQQQCIAQNGKFLQWDSKKNWQLFHSSHYDWWAFPIDQSSGSYGTAYKLQPQHIIRLRTHPQFIQALKSNATLVCRSWGWNLQSGTQILNATSRQKWQRWPIRLSKMCRSLELFAYAGDDSIDRLFVNAIKYAMILLKQYKKFTYGGEDLTPYFIQQEKLIQLLAKDKDKNKHKEQGEKYEYEQGQRQDITNTKAQINKKQQQPTKKQERARTSSKQVPHL